jgi:hypothetical protein
MLQAEMTLVDAILVLVPAVVLAIVWYLVGRSGGRGYWRGYNRGYDNGYSEGRKDGIEEGCMARDQAWWDDAEKEIDQERQKLLRKR